MPGTQKPRDVSKQETRGALIAAGLAEFAAKGLDLPSLDAICARAGFTRGAFYVHFRDRDDFLVAVMEDVFQTFLDTIIATGDDAHDLEHTVDRFALAVAAGPEQGAPDALSVGLHRVLDACARSPVLRARFVTMLQDGARRLMTTTQHGQQAGTVRDDVDAGQLGQLLMFVALGVLAAVDTGVPFDPHGVRAAALRLLQPLRTSRREPDR